AWRMIGDSPWVGQGIGSVWHDRSNPVTQQLVREIGFDAAHAHNGILDVLLATGVVGLVAIVALLASSLRTGVTALRHRSTSGFGRWTIIIASSLIVMSASEPLL